MITVARTQGALEDLDDEIRAAGGSATLVPVDVTDLDAHDRLADAVFARWGRLDVLMLNAGALGLITPVRDLDRKVLNEVMSVNVTANWSLLKALDPALRASPSGRVIAITLWRSNAREALLGCLCHEQGGAGCHDPQLCRGNAHADADQGDAGEPGPDAHRDAA